MLIALVADLGCGAFLLAVRIDYWNRVTFSWLKLRSLAPLGSKEERLRAVGSVERIEDACALVIDRRVIPATWSMTGQKYRAYSFTLQSIVVAASHEVCYGVPVFHRSIGVFICIIVSHP